MDGVEVVIRLAAVRIIPRGNIAWLAEGSKVNIQKCRWPECPHGYGQPVTGYSHPPTLFA